MDNPRPNRDGEPRLNHQIQAREVRVVDDQGGMLGVMATYEALKLARERGLDLVEISPNAVPPVVKILDYGKFKYQKKKKEHQARKNQVQVEVKEVQLRPNTDVHDIDYKVKNVQRFLQEGNKAKIAVMFRGREIVFPEQGKQLLQRFLDLIGPVAMIEQEPKLEGRKMIMIVGPAKGAQTHAQNEDKVSREEKIQADSIKKSEV